MALSDNEGVLEGIREIDVKRDNNFKKCPNDKNAI